MTRHDRPARRPGRPTPPPRPRRRRGRRPGRPSATARASSGAAPSRTRPSATPRGRRSPTSARAATRPSARPTSGSVAAARTAAGPRRGRPPRRARRARAPTSGGARPGHRQRPAVRGDPAPGIDHARPSRPGIEIERRWTPLARVGAYVPGGSAPYPSSLVMTVVPAQVAGVGAIIVASPGGPRRPIHPVLLGAAGLLEVDAFIVAGGAQAIGALAYGLPDAGIAARRPDRRPRQRLGHGGEDRGLRRGRHRPAGRAVRGHGPRRAAGRPAPRRRRPHHPGRARPRLAGHPRHHGRRVRRGRRGPGRRAARTRAARATS